MPPVRNDLLKYYLHTPKGLNTWIVDSSPKQAIWLYEHANEPNAIYSNDNGVHGTGFDLSLSEIIKKGHQYKNKDVVTVNYRTSTEADGTKFIGVDTTAECQYVIFVNNKWGGWVDAHLIEPTEETLIILGDKAAIEAKYEAERRAEDEKAAKKEQRKIQEEQQRIRIERLKIQAACSVIYQNTINKKVSDLTVREEQQIRACQALGVYN
jgi:hypothetical protein